MAILEAVVADLVALVAELRRAHAHAGVLLVGAAGGGRRSDGRSRMRTASS